MNSGYKLWRKKLTLPAIWEKFFKVNAREIFDLVGVYNFLIPNLFKMESYALFGVNYCFLLFMHSLFKLISV